MPLIKVEFQASILYRSIGLEFTVDVKKNMSRQLAQFMKKSHVSVQ